MLRMTLRAAATLALLVCLVSAATLLTTRRVAAEPPTDWFTHPDCAQPCWRGLYLEDTLADVEAVMMGMNAQHRYVPYAFHEGNLLFETDTISGRFHFWDGTLDNFTIHKEVCVRDVLLAFEPVELFSITEAGEFVLYYPQHQMVFFGTGSVVRSSGFRPMRIERIDAIRSSIPRPNAWRFADRHFRAPCTLEEEGAAP